MTPHSFFNLLEGRTRLARLEDGVWSYPKELKDRYNASVERLEKLAEDVNTQLAVMTTLEKEQMKHTAAKYESNESDDQPTKGPNQ